MTSDRETPDHVWASLLQWALQDCRLSANQVRSYATRYQLTEPPTPDQQPDNIDAGRIAEQLEQGPTETVHDRVKLGPTILLTDERIEDDRRAARTIDEWECDDPDCPDNIDEQLDRAARRGEGG